KSLWDDFALPEAGDRRSPEWTRANTSIGIWTTIDFRSALRINLLMQLCRFAKESTARIARCDVRRIRRCTIGGPGSEPCTGVYRGNRCKATRPIWTEQARISTLNVGNSLAVALCAPASVR